jgi:hypothetical protein
VFYEVYANTQLVDFVKHMKFNPKIYDPDSWYYTDPDPSAPFQAELEGYDPYYGYQYFHNHVPSSMLKGLWEDAPWITFLREPVSWLISCYWFAKSLRHIPSEMGIWDYLELDYRKNWMTMLVGDLSKYDFIGFQETWRDDAQSVLERYALPTKAIEFGSRPIPTRNVSTDQEYIRFAKDMSQDKMFIRRCKKLHKEDFKLYQSAKEEFK